MPASSSLAPTAAAQSARLSRARPTPAAQAPTLPRNPGVYAPADAAAIGLTPWAFGELAKLLTRVLQGEQLLPPKAERDIPLPALRPARFVGRRNGTFATTDDVLLLLLRHYVQGCSQQQLATAYGKKQVCLSHWLKRAKPYWLTVLRFCCYYSHQHHIRIAKKVMSNAKPLAALYLELRVKRGRVYNSYSTGRELPL